MKIVEGGFCQRREANPGHGALGESCLERLEMRIQIRVVRAKCCQKRRSFVKNIFLGWEMVVQKPQLVGGDVDGFGQRESGGRSRFHLRLGIESTDREDGKVAFWFWFWLWFGRFQRWKKERERGNKFGRRGCLDRREDGCTLGFWNNETSTVL